jgi:aminoglycoside phosphotransferase
MELSIRLSPQHRLIHQFDKAKAQGNVVSGHDGGTLVLRISDSIVAKCGPRVRPSEAATQKHAYRYLSCRAVRVPEVIRYFQDHSDASRPVGYLFMEHVSGKTLADLDFGVDDVPSRLAGVIAELGRLPGDVPGPVGGGVPHGALWGDDASTEAFGSLEDLNRWLNERLEPAGKAIDLRPYPLVLCHLDLCSRNIMITEGDTICLLGWGHAGFFPRFFEIAAASCVDDEDAYAQDLLRAVRGVARPTEKDQECVGLLLKARPASSRY